MSEGLRRGVYLCLALLVSGALLAGVDYSGVEQHGQVPVEGSWLVEIEADVSPAVREAVARLGGLVRFEYRILPGTWNVQGLSRQQAELLAVVPGVRRVMPDYEVHADMMESAPIVQATPAQKAAAGFGGIDGTGVTICVVDTGVRHSHIVFQGRSSTSLDWDFVNNDDDASDDNGHGTHCAGTAAGGDEFTVSGEPWQGIAHEADIVAVKVLNSSGGGTAAWVIGGIDYCAGQPGASLADVISLSLGGGLFGSACDGDPIAAAANNAVDNGVVVVAAAGNECDENRLSSPACGSKVISVGATWDSAGSRSPRFGCLVGSCSDRNYQVDDHVCFSNQSEMLSVCAPGAATTSATNSGDSSLSTYYGTSQATPHVAGLAALLLHQDGSRDPATVRQLIEDGAVDLGTAGFDKTFGHGRIDVVASLQGQSSGCGNGTCDPNEDPCSCPADCGAPPAQETNCSDGVDNDCDTLTDCDDTADCDGDPACGCGNGTCDGDENPCTCPGDCGAPPLTESNCSDGVDNDCDGLTDGQDPDCGTGPGCGDGVCAGNGEDCVTCPQDCRSARNGADCCGDGQCTRTENPNNCSADCS